MRFFYFTLILLTTSTAIGQDEVPQSPRAVNAGKAYKKAISRASETYRKELDAALRSATQEGDTKEIIRITRVISNLKRQIIAAPGPIVHSRQALENSTWTMERGREKIRLDFGEDYNVSRSNVKGAWTMLNPQSAAIFIGPEIFVLKFNDRFTGYSVLSAYTEVNTKFTNGIRVAN